MSHDGWSGDYFSMRASVFCRGACRRSSGDKSGGVWGGGTAVPGGERSIVVGASAQVCRRGAGPTVMHRETSRTVIRPHSTHPSTSGAGWRRRAANKRSRLLQQRQIFSDKNNHMKHTHTHMRQNSCVKEKKKTFQKNYATFPSPTDSVQKKKNVNFFSSTNKIHVSKTMSLFWYYSEARKTESSSLCLCIRDSPIDSPSREVIGPVLHKSLKRCLS